MGFLSLFGDSAPRHQSATTDPKKHILNRLNGYGWNSDTRIDWGYDSGTQNYTVSAKPKVLEAYLPILQEIADSTVAPSPALNISDNRISIPAAVVEASGFLAGIKSRNRVVAINVVKGKPEAHHPVDFTFTAKIKPSGDSDEPTR